MCCADRTGDLTDFCLQRVVAAGWPVTSTTLLAIQDTAQDTFLALRDTAQDTLSFQTLVLRWILRRPMQCKSLHVEHPGAELFSPNAALG